MAYAFRVEQLPPPDDYTRATMPSSRQFVEQRQASFRSSVSKPSERPRSPSAWMCSGAGIVTFAQHEGATLANSVRGPRAVFRRLGPTAPLGIPRPAGPAAAGE